MSQLTPIQKDVFAAALQPFKDVYGEEAAARLRQEIGFLPQLIEANPALGSCHPDTVAFSLGQCAILGISIMPARKQAYLVPFKDKCQLMLGYKGKIDILANAGVIISAEGGAVRQGDKFTYENTQDGFTFSHRKALQNRGPIIGAYAALTLPSGRVHGVFLTNAEIGKRKAVAKSMKFWGAWEDEMSIKTALHVAVSMLPSCQAVDQMNLTEKWLLNADATPAKEMSDERLEEIKAILQEAESMKKAFMALPAHEQQSEKVREIYKELLEAKKQAA